MAMHYFSFPFASPFYDESISLRDDILRKPLGLAFSVDELAREYGDFHFGAFNQHMELVACLVLVPLENGSIKMRQVAVLESLQGSGQGTALVQASELFCKKLRFSKIVLNARETAVNFYLKMDYTKIGDVFTEVGIPHYKMYKDI
jgi:predicted GNAT family N-acyltransferase